MRIESPFLLVQERAFPSLGGVPINRMGTKPIPPLHWGIDCDNEGQSK
jgi:hypothetical protein